MKSTLSIVPILLALVLSCRAQQDGQPVALAASESNQANTPASHGNPNSNHIGTGLEGRAGERGFIKDIVDRLHALDADIGKLLYNSTSMYAPDDKAAVFLENQPRGGERFTEVLTDLDALQDEVSFARSRSKGPAPQAQDPNQTSV